MFKDIIETVINELHNENNKKQVEYFIGPFINKLKTSYYIIIVLLVLIVGNLVYSNILLSEIIKIPKIIPNN